MLQPLKQFYCDGCGQEIERIEHAYVEWIATTDRHAGIEQGEGYQVIHHHSVSPVGGHDCEFYTRHPKRRFMPYGVEQKNILEERELWTYKSILPYAINIFSSDNIKPKSRVANVINFLHNFVVYLLLLAMIGSLLLNIITLKKN